MIEINDRVAVFTTINSSDIRIGPQKYYNLEMHIAFDRLLLAVLRVNSRKFLP